MNGNSFSELTRRDMDSLRTLTLCGAPFNAARPNYDTAEFDLTRSRLRELDGMHMYIKGLRFGVILNLVDRPYRGPDIYIDPVVGPITFGAPIFPAAWGVSLSWLLARSRVILSGYPALRAFAEELSNARSPYGYLKELLTTREVQVLLPWTWRFMAVEDIVSSEELKELEELEELEASLSRIKSAWETLVGIDMQLDSTVLYNTASASSAYGLRYADRQESVEIRESLLNAMTDRMGERQAEVDRAKRHRSWTAALRDTRLAHVKSRDLAELLGASASRVRAYRSGDGASSTERES